MLFLCGCSNISYYEAERLRRAAYVNTHLAEIRQTNKELLVQKSFGFFPFWKQIEQDKQALELVVGLMCGDDPNVIVSKVVEIGRGSEKDKAELSELVNSFLKDEDFQSCCRIFEIVMLEGCIIEGMTVEQVEASWGQRLNFLSSGSGYDLYEGKFKCQEDMIVGNEQLSITSTIPSSGGKWRDFYLTFKNGRLLNWTSFPHVSEPSYSPPVGYFYDGKFYSY